MVQPPEPVQAPFVPAFVQVTDAARPMALARRPGGTPGCVDGTSREFDDPRPGYPRLWVPFTVTGYLCWHQVAS